MDPLGLLIQFLTTSVLLQETWLLSEFCDKGNLDRALSGGRFHDKATGKPEMVRSMRFVPVLCRAYCNRHGNFCLAGQDIPKTELSCTVAWKDVA